MPLKMTLLIALCLWVMWGGCGVSLETLGARCDNGKLSLDRDMPAGSVNWDCPVSSWPASTQEPFSIIETLYDTEPARQICMDTYISYSQTIPTSGAFRPVRAESGEYLYCPPQRWLNNLHHEAVVLLYHPCIPPHEHLLLSVLARSCLPDYIMTPFKGLKKHTPIVLVSWGRTLELSTMATSAICNWLETTTSLGNKSDVRRSRNYNLLLTWSAETQQRLPYPEEYPAKLKESLRQCCEQTLSSLLNDVKEAEVQSHSKKRSLKQFKEKGKILPFRASLRGKQKRHINENMKESTTNVSRFFSHQNKSDSFNRKGDDEKHNSPYGSSADLLSENKILSYPPSQSKGPSHLKSQTVNPSLTPRSTALLASKMALTALKTVSESKRFRLSQQKAVQESNIRHTGFRGPKLSAQFKFNFDVVKRGHNYTARRETLALSSKGEGRAFLEQSDEQSVKSEERHSDKKNIDGRIKNKEVVYVKEREVENLQTHSDTHSLNISETTGSNSISKSESETHFHPSFVPQLYPNQQPASYMPKRNGCNGCQEGELCNCKDSWIVDKGLPRTPRTDEALWAAAALGFLLVLLTLSVLHTRLYRFWRTSPSLYWHDPKQDYDRVADVIHRRLRFVKRKQQRGRRQECVLLPSSSSSDEHL